MGRKSKISKEEKIRICKRYLAGEGSYEQLAKSIDVTLETVRRWIVKYKVLGEHAFDYKPKNSSYTKEFKETVVLAYLFGEGSLTELAIKYSISSCETLRRWVNDYNSHIELKDYDPGERKIYMTKSRKVDTKERIEIAKFCIDHNLNYKKTAEVYDTTYTNVFNWVKKYKERGEEGLIDKRGKHKTDEEVDELTLLRRQNERLRHELEMKELEVRLLKKVDEIERRRFTDKVNSKLSTKQYKK